MSNPIACAACGAEAPTDAPVDPLFVCNACLGLPDRPVSATKPAEPPSARRAVESAPPTPARTARGSWLAVARGYRHLWTALVVFLLGTILAVFVRILESAYRVPLLTSWISMGTLALTLLTAVVMRLVGAVTVANKPRRGRVKGLARAVRGFAFVPLINLLVFPLLLAVYTSAVGRETGVRSVRRAGWILLGCAVVLVPPILWVLASVGFWAISLLIVFLDPPASSHRPTAATATPAGDDSAAFYLLFILGAGCLLWLGAYITTMVTLVGVARALERTAAADPADVDSDADRPTDEPA